MTGKTARDAQGARALSPQVPLYGQEAFRRAAGNAWRPGGAALTEYALDVCAYAAGARVLDVGCGAGDTLALLRARGLWACGLDAQSWAATAREAADIPRVVGDGAALPIRAGALDGVVCQCVLSLLPDAATALRGMAEALRPGGVLLLSDVFARDGERCGAAVPATKRTACWQGAAGWSEQEQRLRGAGFRLVLAEDHSAALRDLAARMVWYGVAREALPRWLGRQGGCAGGGFGYGLWIARKGDATCKNFS